jgi:hypothetical protein
MIIAEKNRGKDFIFTIVVAILTMAVFLIPTGFEDRQKSRYIKGKSKDYCRGQHRT